MCVSPSAASAVNGLVCDPATCECLSASSPLHVSLKGMYAALGDFTHLNEICHEFVERDNNVRRFFNVKRKALSALKELEEAHRVMVLDIDRMRAEDELYHNPVSFLPARVEAESQVPVVSVVPADALPSSGDAKRRKLSGNTKAALKIAPAAGHIREVVQHTKKTIQLVEEVLHAEVRVESIPAMTNLRQEGVGRFQEAQRIQRTQMGWTPLTLAQIQEAQRVKEAQRIHDSQSTLENQQAHLPTKRARLTIEEAKRDREVYVANCKRIIASETKAALAGGGGTAALDVNQRVNRVQEAEVVAAGEVDRSTLTSNATLVATTPVLKRMSV